MARIKVTGYMDADDMGRFHDPKHSMGITNEGFEGATVAVILQDVDGGVTVHLDEIDYEAVDD